MTSRSDRRRRYRRLRLCRNITMNDVEMRNWYRRLVSLLAKQGGAPMGEQELRRIWSRIVHRQIASDMKRRRGWRPGR